MTGATSGAGTAYPGF